MLSIFDEFDQSYNKQEFNVLYKFEISKYSYINNNNFGFQNLFIYEMPNF